MVKSDTVNGERLRKIDPIETQEYKMPTEVYFGRGEIKTLPNIIDSSGFSNYLFVAGEHFYKEKSNESLLKELTDDERVELYVGRIKKSTFEEVNSLVQYVQEGQYDGIIGLGGGAILDSTKVAAVLATNGGSVEDYLIQKSSEISKRGIFCIALPTTSGTGSEVTPWSVVWGRDKKFSLSAPEYMFPDIAIVDPALTDDCSKEITATSGIDALCQAIEAYWSINHNPVSDEYALEAISTIFGSLKDAVSNPTNEARDSMAWGSLNGGLSFSNTQTTICHSVSYPMTLHWNVPHGQATSITLPEFIKYTFPVIEEERRKKILDSMEVSTEEEAADKTRTLMESIGLKTRLSDLGIPKEGIEIIVDEGFDPARAGNAPRIPSTEELTKILASIY